jgi:hypothetical protein
VTYQVTAPLVLARDAEGAYGYFYKGAILPPYVQGDALQGLLDSRMVAQVVADPALTPAASEPPPVENLGGPLSRPAQVASKQAWVDYAVAQGATAEDAEKATKQELVELYGG